MNKESNIQNDLSIYDGLISVLIGTCDRPKSLLRCLKSVLKQKYMNIEILILDDYSRKYNICKIIKKQVCDKRIRCFRSNQQLGVAGVRNLLMRKARGDIFCFIDDDAYFDNSECISLFTKIFNRYKNVGIISVKIMDYSNGNKNIIVPFSRYNCKRYPHLIEETHFVSYFLGGCHAIRRNVIERCGFYEEKLMFNGEELDLSFRVINEGISILYFPFIKVHHVPEPSVFNDKKKEIYYSIRNTLWISSKYLPIPYAVIYIIIRSIYSIIYAIKRKAIWEFYCGFKDGLFKIKRNKRTILNKKAIRYLRMNYGRLWY